MILGIILSVIAIAGIVWLVVDVFSDNEPKLGREKICYYCTWQYGRGEWARCGAPFNEVIGCPYNQYKG